MDLLGIAAIISALGAIATPFLLVLAKRLDAIDRAVNTRSPGTPTMSQDAAETRRLAGEMHESVGELRGMLEAHTEQDQRNFDDLRRIIRD